MSRKLSTDSNNLSLTRSQIYHSCSSNKLFANPIAIDVQVRFIDSLSIVNARCLIVDNEVTILAFNNGDSFNIDLFEENLVSDITRADNGDLLYDNGMT